MAVSFQMKHTMVTRRSEIDTHMCYVLNIFMLDHLDCKGYLLVHYCLRLLNAVILIIMFDVFFGEKISYVELELRPPGQNSKLAMRPE